MEWIGVLLLCLGSYGFGVWVGRRNLRTVRQERDDAWQVLDDVGQIPQRSKAAPRHNDGRSDVRRARWGSQRNWRR